ncbi:MAG: BACON domain-containing protein [Bacteroidales bacterium]|nr:BACON domain-containing protein [Bacteroidales bacterium]
MKKYIFSLIILAAAVFTACDKPVVKTLELGVDPGQVFAAATETSASLEVESNCAWKASSNNSAFTVSPASGNGNGTVTVSFPENKTTSEVKAVITFSTSEKEGTPLSLEVEIIQSAAEPEPEPEPTPDPGTGDVKNPQTAGQLAEWVFCTENFEYFNAHFPYDDAKAKDAEGNFIAGKPGYVSEDHYCPSSTGNGRIRFLNVEDKSSPSVNPKGVVKRGMGNYGEPCFYGPVKSDVVNIYATPAEPYDGIAAGTKVRLFMALRPNTKNTAKYWILEVKDGEEWAPVGTVKKTTAIADEGEIEYNVELVYNPDGQGMQPDADGNKTIFPDNPQQINTFIDQTYTFKTAVASIEYRLTCTSNIGADGVTTAFPLSNGGTAVLRIAGKSSNSGGAHPVEDPMVIEIVK